MRMSPALMMGVGVFGCGDSSTAKPTCETDPSLCVEPEVDSAEPETEPPDSGVQPDPDSGTATPTDSGESPEDSGEPPVEPPSNLLVNPGFETGESPWSIWGGAERVPAHARTGEWSVKTTETNGAEQVVVGLDPNTVYRLSGWGKISGTEPLLLGVKDYGGDERRVSFTDASYQEASLTFTTGFSNTQAVIYAYKHASDEPAYADDLVLHAVGPSDRTLIWSDEFDGVGPLDDSRWTHETGFVRNEELQWYQTDNAFQEDGLLVIEGRTEDRPNPGYVAGSSDWRTSRETITHTSASVTTKDRFDWQYGHLVVRAKVTNHTGTWPAIWTLGTSCEWPSNGEVDVMENYGGNILANFAWGTDSRWTPRWDSSHWPVTGFGDGWTDAFHIWEMEWTEDRMTIRLDGAVLNDVALSETFNGTAACAGENPFRQPHRLLLNLALGGAGGSVDDLAFPTRYLVDYVRVYQ